MFKNLLVYPLGRLAAKTSSDLALLLKNMTFQECSSSEMSSEGWVPPHKDGELVHAVGGHFLLEYATAKKLLPTSVINQFADARADETEEAQGFPPGRKQMKEIKEQVTDELLPKAFTIQKSTSVWIDPIHGWLVIDTASIPKAESILASLYKCIDKFPVSTLRTARSPLSAMTDWLVSDEAPAGFTVDQDTELRASGDSKATVRYLRHTLEGKDLRQHIEAGKQCTRLALTWNDRMSFVLTENLTIKKLTPLDVLKEESAGDKNDLERADSDFLLMAGEVNKMLPDLIAALGGVLVDEDAAPAGRKMEVRESSEMEVEEHV